MKRRNLRATVLMAIILILATTVTAFAVDEVNWTTSSDVTQDSLQEYYSSASEADKASIRKALSKNTVGENDNATYNIEVDGVNYRLDDAGFSSVQSKVYSMNSDKAIKQQVEQIGVDFNTKADTEAATEMLSGIESIASLVTGLVVVVVVIGFSVFTAFDVAYITLPIFRGKCNDYAVAHADSKMTVNKTKNGEAKLRVVTDEAMYAVQVCTIESGRNPLTTYLFKRIWAYIAVAIVIYILLSGNISVLVSLALNAVSGIMSVVSSIAG